MINVTAGASVERKIHRITLDDVSSAGRGVFVIELIGGGLSSPSADTEGASENSRALGNLGAHILRA